MKVSVNKTIPVIMAILIMNLTLISMAYADQLDWKTERVYFKGETLILEGTFYNDTSNTVDHVNEFRARVKLLRHDEWRQIASATFKDIDIYIRPGGSKNFTFRIHDVEPRRIEKWKVNTWMEYHFLNRHRDERQRHHRDWD